MSAESREQGQGPADNRERAEQALAQARRLPPGLGRELATAEAQVLATLAVADETREFRRELHYVLRPRVAFTPPTDEALLEQMKSEAAGPPPGEAG